MARTTLKIEGMSCDGCVRSVREALERNEGVQPMKVEIGTVVVEHDAETVDEAGLMDIIEKAGFTASGAYPE